MIEEGVDQMDQKVTKYEHFVNEVLRNDLRRVVERQQVISQQLTQYLHIQAVIQSIQHKHVIDGQQSDNNKTQLKMQTDLGSNFYVQTIVRDARKLYLMVGMGFYVELTLEEAISLIHRRQTLLKQELQQLSTQSAKIKANIKLIMETIEQIIKL